MSDELSRAGFTIHYGPSVDDGDDEVGDELRLRGLMIISAFVLVEFACMTGFGKIPEGEFGLVAYAMFLIRGGSLNILGFLCYALLPTTMGAALIAQLMDLARTVYLAFVRKRAF